MNRTTLVGALVGVLCSVPVWASDGNVPASAGYETGELIDDKGWLGLDGVIVDQVVARDSDHFERDTTRGGAMVHYASPYQFIALGASRDTFRQGDWSTRVDSVVLAGRHVDRRTAAGFNGRLALTTNTDKIQWHGEANWNIRLSESTGAEFIANRDAVETEGALQRGILSNFVALSVDHALTERLTLIGMPTYRHFTDGNEQVGGRGWAVYNLLPEAGISVQLKGMAYRGVGDSGGLYFHPDFYERGEVGLRLRRSIGDWRVFAVAEVGRERIDHDIEKPTAEFRLTAQRSFANNVTAGVQFSYYRAAGVGTQMDTGDDYDWGMGRVYVSIPLF